MSVNPLRPEEQEVISMADRLGELLNRGADWANSYLQDSQIRAFMLKNLHEMQITAKRIGESAHRPMAIGVFGASQCGKSYLVSELVRGSDKTLAVLLNKFGGPSQPHDYLDEINPAGGRESTAIVTRFTSRPYRQITGCAAAVRLLSVTDLVKILLNGFLFECQSDFLPTAEELQKVRFSFRAVSRSKQGNALLTETDVWDLQDYARRHFRNQFVKALEDIDYWGILHEEIRFLPADQQITYLEWLWGRFPKMTQLFRHLIGALGNLGSEIVGLSDDALIPRENSIIDVQRLSQLMKVGNRKCSVMTATGSPVPMDAAVLCALTAELILEVHSTQKDSLVQTADMLDFPGARARAQIYDESRLEKDQAALVEVFLRGKVAYLFDRFSDDRDITGLILCQEGGPQEAKSLPYMINKWVEWSMGADAKSRQGKKPLLFHVFTKFDSDLIWKKGQDPQVRWDSRLRTNFEEFFGKAGTWVEDWDGVTAFQNCYWVRNPNVQQTVFGRDQQGNEFVREEAQLNEIMNQYLGNELVRRHFKNPQESWNRAAKPGQSGIPFLVESVNGSVEPLAKVKQLKQNLLQLLADLKSHLQPHFVGDDVAKARQQAEERARKRLAVLSKEMAFKYSLPQILDRERFSISDKLVSMVFDRVVNPMNDEEETAGGGGVAQPQAQVFEADIFAVGGETPPAAAPEVPKKTPPRKGEVFAQGVLNLWQEQLVRLAKDKTLHQKTGLDADWFAEVTQEIIKGASRLRLSEQLAAVSDTFLNAPNPGRFVRKTGVLVSAKLNRFVLQLGQPRPEREIPPFAPKASLSARAYPGLALYQAWTNAMITLFKDNVAAATAADEQSNAALKTILQTSLS